MMNWNDRWESADRQSKNGGSVNKIWTNEKKKRRDNEHKKEKKMNKKLNARAKNKKKVTTDKPKQNISIMKFCQACKSLQWTLKQY